MRTEGSATPDHLGAHWNGQGVGFGVFSEHAARVDLCLFDDPGSGRPVREISLLPASDGLWYAYVEGLAPGQLYGIRAWGPYEQQPGLRFNPYKLLLDPYARAVAGVVRWDDCVYGYVHGGAAAEDSFDSRDSAAYVPKSVVVDPTFDWGDAHPPNTPWSRTVVYECHVKGMTMRHPGVPAPLRGTFRGLASPCIIEHLLSLGVTAVELLPVHHCLSRRALQERGLCNYWGYDSIAFFAPDARFASGDRGEQVGDFQAMVKAFHAAGMEVILDVVYNHTVEGDRLGPTLCFRGLDNSTYYRLDPRQRREYEDFSGCGNTLRLEHAAVLRLVLDSLRYWVRHMHVDGFRFDLGTALSRTAEGFSPEAPFLQAVQADPLLSHVKLIVEPWDATPHGYRLGAFPDGWAEWNDRYRDTVRRFWRGDAGQAAEFASRLTGSSDIFAERGRRRGPLSSVNFVTCHDGFTLCDLVTYAEKRNHANGELNRDGAGHNYSWNRGVEGPTDRRDVLHLRRRDQRTLLATLALSSGVPMLCGGDELGRTQAGNNNAYCQDNAVSWVDWSPGTERQGLLGFARRVLALRRRFSALFDDRYYQGVAPPGEPLKDLTWLREDGREMTEPDWRDAALRTLGALFHRAAAKTGETPGSRAQTLLLLLNAGARRTRFRLPACPSGGRWRRVLDSGRRQTRERELPGTAVSMLPHSLVVLTI
ncbi:MAG: glycogen debranching protein GlgX [Planctomycetes bacterium]|nr:glycogen debranching protein GlgX [Planctomycetota bacterium]